MGNRLSAPGPQEKRFAAYIEGLAKAAGHTDRHLPLKNYSAGLLLPGDRKSVEPMAARIAPDNVRQTHQSMHHLVADAPWDDDQMLAQVQKQVLPTMTKQAPVVAWIVDDTGVPKKGKHSVGVARQYCGQVGKQENCQVAVSLSISTWSSSLPIAWRLYLPEAWANDSERREKAKVPQEITFQTKPKIALDQIRRAIAQGAPQGVILADAGYGVDTQFRTSLTELKLQYVVGIQSTATVWEPGHAPLAPESAQSKKGRPSKRLHRDEEHPPVSVKEIALSLPSSAFKSVPWREGSQRKLSSRFAAVPVRPAHRDQPHAEEWLLIEWPKGESEPAKYWLSTMPPTTKLKDLVKMAKHRWIIKRDYEELKRNWAWVTTKDEAGAGFIIKPLFVLPRMGSWSPSGTVFPPPHTSAMLDYAPQNLARTSARGEHRIRPERHNAGSIATLRIEVAVFLMRQLPCCPFCQSRYG